jgi:acyl transferase domain-containing protein
MIGQGLGEYTAACLAGVLSLEDALGCVVLRSRLLERLANAEEVPALLSDEWNKFIANVSLRAPRIPYVSSLTGTWITPEEATTVSYWCAQFYQTAPFVNGLQTLLQDSSQILMEVGPGRTLCSLIDQQGQSYLTIASFPKNQDGQMEEASLLTALGRLWLAGISVDWPNFSAGEQRWHVALPTYPFEKQKHWIEPVRPSRSDRKPIEKSSLASRTEIEKTISTIWQDLLGIETLGINDNFWEMGGDSLIAMHVITQIRATLQTDLPLQCVLDYPTIASLAMYLHKEGYAEH